MDSDVKNLVYGLMLLSLTLVFSIVVIMVTHNNHIEKMHEMGFEQVPLYGTTDRVWHKTSASRRSLLDDLRNQ